MLISSARSVMDAVAEWYSKQTLTSEASGVFQLRKAYFIRKAPLSFPNLGKGGGGFLIKMASQFGRKPEKFNVFSEKMEKGCILERRSAKNSDFWSIFGHFWIDF